MGFPPKFCFLKSSTGDPLIPLHSRECRKQIPRPPTLVSLRNTTNFAKSNEIASKFAGHRWCSSGKGQLLGSMAPASLHVQEGGSTESTWGMHQLFYTQLSCKLRAQDNFGDHCLLNSPLPGLQAIHPSHAAELTGEREKENAKAAHLLCKGTILHIPEEANNWFCCRNRMGFQRKRGVTHMTAISFLRMLNLVTKLALPRESLMSTTEGQGERSAALSLGH